MRITRDVYMVGSGAIRLSNEHDCHIYLIDGGEELALVDAGVGLQSERIVENIRTEGFDPKRISRLLLTHCHADHAGGCRYLKEATGCDIVCTEAEGRLLAEGTEEELGLDIAKRTGVYPQDYTFCHVRPDRIVRHGDTLTVGRYDVEVVEVPGHSRGIACYLLDQGGYRILFSSDVVFLGGTIGLGNWPGSTLDGYRSHIGRLANLAVDALLPGHFLWTLQGGQSHLDGAVENLQLAWVPPAWQVHHPHR